MVASFTAPLILADASRPASARPRLNLTQLRTFDAVAALGSIRAAARQLGLTQPAVTYQMRELEAAIGSPLVLRSRTGVTLTPLGQALRLRTASLLADLRRAEEEIARLREGAGERLVVACSSGSAMQLLANALRVFRDRQPDITVEVHEINLAASADVHWQSGQCDLMVVNEVEPQPRPGLQQTLLLRTPLVVTARQDHPLRAARSVKALRHCPWLMPPYGAAFVEQMQAGLHLAPGSVALLSHSLQFSLAILRGSDALALVSEYLHRDPWLCAGLVRVPVRDTLPHAHVSALRREAVPVSPATRRFVECLRAVAAEAAPPAERPLPG